MEQEHLISAFLNGVKKNPNIGATHISVFVALAHYWSFHGRCTTFRVYSYEIMAIAKISSRSTYFKCMADLKECGYLCYEASRNRNAASRISLPVTPDKKFLNKVNQ